MSNGIYDYVDDVKERLAEKDKRIAELEEQLEEVEGQYAYECECNKQFVECQNENEKLKAENERLKKYETIYYMNQLQANNEDINKFKQNEFQQCINIFELLKENTKQVRKEIVQQIKEALREKLIKVTDDAHFYSQNAVHWQDVVAILDQIATTE